MIKLEKINNKWGFLFGGTFITNPFISECGRFNVVDPKSHYGLNQSQIDILNK